MAQIPDYPSNSDRGNISVGEKKREKKEKVISGTVKKRDAGIAGKIQKTMNMPDSKTFKNYVVDDVLIPSIRDAIRTVLSSAVDALFGGGERSSKRSSTRASWTTYSKSKTRETKPIPPWEREFEYDEVILDSRADAEKTIDALQDIIDEYGMASVADLYDIVGMDNDNWSLNDYGWTNVRSARVQYTRDGFWIRMPKARPLNND